ncbi:hypothetical protein INT45_012559 [Circinella minor]|uniref:GATA-type domain-containing protein n=1 Tax=Circinella minor TaxID=1195481 RepID=A0A8H7S1W6_9FUNG|nr:hypothetical protein INT45_012559 [Circinella minor]
MTEGFDLDLSTFLPPLPSPTVSDDFPISPVPEVVDPSLLNLAVLQSLFLQQQHNNNNHHHHSQQIQHQQQIQIPSPHPRVVVPLDTAPSPPQQDDLDQFVKFEQEQQGLSYIQTAATSPSTSIASPVTETTSSPPSPSPTTTTPTITTNSTNSTKQTNSSGNNNKQQQRPARQLECFNCHVTKTPLWRRTPDRAHSLCNACGLYYKQYGTHRPLHIRQKTPNKKIQQQQAQQQAQQQQQQQLVATVAANLLRPLLQARCASCFQTHAPLWRKNDRGEPLCHACDIYSSPQVSNAGQKRGRDWDMPTTPTATSSMTTSPLLVGDEDHPNKKQALSEMDDTRFKGLLSRMNKEQMFGFLEMLERRCAILRNVLFEEEQQQQQ